MYQRVAQVNHGGTTPQTPQTRPVSLEAEEITRRNLDVRPQGESINRGDRGAFGRASTPWWMGRHGKAKGGAMIKDKWSLIMEKMTRGVP